MQELLEEIGNPLDMTELQLQVRHALLQVLFEYMPAILIGCIDVHAFVGCTRCSSSLTCASCGVHHPLWGCVVPLQD